VGGGRGEIGAFWIVCGCCVEDEGFGDHLWSGLSVIPELMWRGLESMRWFTGGRISLTFCVLVSGNVGVWLSDGG
jgi:hypothetical protein